MTIQVERAPDHTSAQLETFKAVSLAERSDSLSEVIARLQANESSFRHLVFGEGGNHVWVSLKSTNERVLFITE